MPSKIDLTLIIQFMINNDTNYFDKNKGNADMCLITYVRAHVKEPKVKILSKKLYEFILLKI
jgi:hypothetical protein